MQRGKPLGILPLDLELVRPKDTYVVLPWEDETDTPESSVSLTSLVGLVNGPPLDQGPGLSSLHSAGKGNVRESKSRGGGLTDPEGVPAVLPQHLRHGARVLPDQAVIANTKEITYQGPHPLQQPARNRCLSVTARLCLVI
jgi:hypothetical protein